MVVNSGDLGWWLNHQYKVIVGISLGNGTVQIIPEWSWMENMALRKLLIFVDACTLKSKQLKGRAVVGMLLLDLTHIN